jgi:hypothetical protein
LLRQISKDATHLTITATIMPDSATAPGQERQGSMSLIVQDAVVDETAFTVDEPLTAAVTMKESGTDAQHRGSRRDSASAGSDAAAAADVSQVGDIEYREPCAHDPRDVSWWRCL